MDCSACRENLSARIDGEQAPSEADAVERHLDECPTCRQWRDDASRLTSALRLRPAEPVPDLTGPVLQAGSVRPRRRRPLRVALAVVAACQLLLGLSQTVGLGHHGLSHAAMSGHLFNESTSWNLALGLGLLFSAIRTNATTGLVPVLAAFLVVLTGFSTVDLLGGQVPVTRLISHGFLVVGFVLLLIVRRNRRPAPSTDAAPTPTSGHHAANALLSTVDDTDSAPSRRPDLRPVNYRRAA